jgi:1-acyl-sn-glycerol-3-phosphate acyltransferase
MLSVLRAILFNICFYVNTVVYMFACLPVLLMPRRALWRAVDSWVATNLWFLKTICGITFEFTGVERIPSGALLVAAKHQSTAETYALLKFFTDPVYVLKRELMWIPIFGWYCLKARMIPVNRGARTGVMTAMAERAKQTIARGRQIIIFPEGTRRPPDAEPAYKYGVAFLYGELDVPCLPVALNSGLYWPRRSWHMRPGVIRVEFLEPIPPGLHPDAFLVRLQNELEPATARLVSVGRSEIEARERRRALLGK